MVIFILFQALGEGGQLNNDFQQQVRAYTREIEFDYIEWTWDAAELKLVQFTLNAADYLEIEDQKQNVVDYLRLVYAIQIAEAHLNDIYADPNVLNPEASTALVRRQLESLYAQRELLGPLAESVLQDMVMATLKEMGFNPGGQPIPPVLYHSTPLPWALIVSPRDQIIQEANIHLETKLNVEQHILLEEEVEEGLDVSSLVVPIGGVGVYPTMVAQTTNLPWLAEVVGHEWIHNYLNLRPLGLLYSHTPELRTMNETAANIAGKEISKALIARFFPEFLPPPPAPPTEESEEEIEAPAPEPPAFDFRAEMHETRITVDSLLEEGKIEEAESYMEERRLLFWENGFRIRKLNQAYFAFHGAYADQPVGAAGEDPVGAAVRQLRAESDSLLAFLHTMSWLTSFEQLQEVLAEKNLSSN